MATLETDARAQVLSFDAATHEYRIDGAPVPSVTQLLEDAGLTPDYTLVPPPVLKHARARGLHIDACADLLDEDALDWSSVSPEAIPYLEAWMRFRDYEGYTPVASQVPLYNAEWGYCGTPDSIGLLPGNRPCLVERKATAKMAATYALQTSGYALDGMWFAPRGGGVLAPVTWGPPARLGVHLRRDGSYQLYRYDDPEDFSAFLGVVALGRWRGARRALHPIRRVW